MNILYVKAIHIIFIVTWFAGLFYLVRLFIYHIEAEGKEEPARSILKAQYEIMEQRLYQIITNPSMFGAVITGGWLLYTYSVFLQSAWMWVKLGLVTGLVVYHYFCRGVMKKCKNGEIRYTSTQMRIINEVATLFLVGIVFLVVLKQTLSLLWGVLGLVLLGVSLMLGIRLYKRLRASRGEA
jgi:protoporphyrinogen IX oxidase